MSQFPGLLDFCQHLYDKQIRSPYLLGCMVDIYENMLELGCDEKSEILKKAVQVINAIITLFCRSKY